jgi:bifunctional ADP-heptose synthase (sugar kinase/adenylyltransferase)
VLDPRSSVEGFAGVTAITPDVDRIEDLSAARSERERGGSLDDPAALLASAEALRARAECRWVLVSRGNLGMALFGEELPEGGVAVEASGAGKSPELHGASDTSAAVFSLALAAGLEATEAMVLANAACGAVAGEPGTAVCTPAQLAGACATAPAAVRLASAPR